MSELYELVREKFSSGKWSRRMLRVLADSGTITEAEFAEILNGGREEHV